MSTFVPEESSRSNKIRTLSQGGRVVQHLGRQQLVQQGGVQAAQLEPAFQVAGQGARPARVRHLGQHAGGVHVGPQVQVDRDLAVAGDGVARQRRQRIDQAALDAGFQKYRTKADAGPAPGKLDG